MSDQKSKPIKMQLPTKETTAKVDNRKNIQKDGSASKNSANVKINQPYAASQTVGSPLTKVAQQLGAGVTHTNPMFFSPLHTPQSWQTASQRKEIYQWARFYYSNEPKVAAAIDFYCFSPSTPILMAGGEQKAISSVRVGDMVRSHDGSENKVIRTYKRQTCEKMLKIKIAGISQGPLECTEGHEILVKRGDSEKFIQAKDLVVGDYLLTPINYGDYNNNLIRKLKRTCSIFSKIMTKCFIEEKYICRKIISIKEKIYDGDVYDLEVENKHSYVANRVSVHNSQFPVNAFKLECKDKKIQRYFERLVDRIDLLRWLRLISHERFLLGDVFVFLEIDSPDTRGETNRPYDEWDHANGTINRIVVLNPDWVEVYTTHLADEPEIVMLPDEELKKIVSTRQPSKIYNRLPPGVRAAVQTGSPIPLSNTVTSHIKHGGAPYGTYGDSILRRLFTTLAYKTKLMTANWIVAERLILPVRVVQIGEPDRPASADDINDVSNQLATVANDPNLTIVTHHAFKYEWYGACYDEKTRVLTDKMGFVDYNILRDEIIYEEENNIPQDEKIKIMVFDPESDSMKYESPLDFFEYDYDGEMINFESSRFDISVTPNHTMLYYKRDDKAHYSQNADEVIQEAESEIYFKNCSIYECAEEVGNIDTKTFNMSRVANDNISKKTYKGKVWCCETSTGFFVTERNGKIAIQGNSGRIHNINAELEYVGKEILDGLMINQALLNGEGASYANGQIGAESLIMRLDTWRAELRSWVEKNIFLPVAKMQGFIDKDETEKSIENNPVYLYPKLKWDDMRIRDNTNKLQMAIQLNQNGKISDQTLLEEFDYDYDYEAERKREEQVEVYNDGLMPGGGGMGGLGAPGGGAAMPGMPPPMPGGDFGGDAGGDPFGGGAGGEMGGMPPGGGDMGGGAPAMPGGGGGADSMAQMNSPKKVYKKGQEPKEKEPSPEELQQMKTTKVSLTRPEAKIYRLLTGMNLNYPIYAQFQQKSPKATRPYIMDFAMPSLLLNIEVDGEKWHTDYEDQKSDRERDQKLAEMGWTVVRFRETAVNENIDSVKSAIEDNIKQAANKMQKLNKKGKK